MDRTSINAIGDDPAFPRDHRHLGHNGMTLRDYFAGQILPTIYPDMQNCGDIARAAYHMADVMIAERAKASRTDETKG